MIDMDTVLSSPTGVVSRTVAEWMEYFDIKEAYARVGDWVVTPYGVECLTTLYYIEWQRLNENDSGYTWEKHMRGKQWVNQDDFRDIMIAARKHFRGTLAREQ